MFTIIRHSLPPVKYTSVLGSGTPGIPGDALTIEPSLYNQSLGGVRIEDLVIDTQDGCENLNHLQ